MASNPPPEPWLRGMLPGIPAHVLPAFFSFAQVREELAQHTAGITQQQLWLQLVGRHSLGYHLKHIAGSVNRLTTYLAGRQLSAAQLDFLKREHVPDAALPELLALIDDTLRSTEQQIMEIKPEILFHARLVGRQALPSSVFGLLVHVCEHSQRHLGQAILLAKLLRQI